MAKLIETVTKGGKLPLYSARLSDAKLMEADKIISGIRANDNQAVTAFKSHLGARFGEAIHTTGDDFIFAFAQIAAFNIQNEWEAATRTWSDAIETETVSSFEAPASYSINPAVDGFRRPTTEPNKPDHVVPLVAEGSPYPHFIFSSEAAQAGSIHKAGGRYDLTFEKIVGDVAGIVPLIPRLITESLLEREEYDAWQGLVDFIDVPANHLVAGESLLGENVVADAPLSRAALAVALRQAANRTIDGRKVSVSAYNLIVPTGAGDDARFLLNTLSLAGLEQTDGSQTQILSVNGYNPLGRISGVVETDYLAGSAWALIPAKGAIRGNKKFYTLGQLAGHIGPEIRLQNVTGQYLGGGTVSPFEGSFETDSAAFRGRIIDGGLGWNSEYAVISDGTGI